MSSLADATAAVRAGRLDDAIAIYEALGDTGAVGASLAFDRGLAYALRARSGQGMGGDYGRAAHGFEEALRRDPHDREAQRTLDEIRREVAKRDARASGRSEELGATPVWRTIVVSLPGDAWASLALVSSLLLSSALALRPRLARGARLAASTIAIVSVLLVVAFSALGLSARWLRTSLHEAVVIAPRAVATPEGDVPRIELDEGERVDVLEQRAGTTLIRTEKGTGWAPRDALRMLPPYRP
jgi:hypothetical protein